MLRFLRTAAVLCAVLLAAIISAPAQTTSQGVFRLVGPGSTQLTELAFDSHDGNLYGIDNGQVVQIQPGQYGFGASSLVSPVATAGAKTIAITSDGNLLVADQTGLLASFSPADGFVTATPVGSGFGTGGASVINGMAVDSKGTLFISTGGSIYSYSSTTSPVGPFGSAPNGATIYTAALPGTVTALAVDGNDRLLIGLGTSIKVLRPTAAGSSVTAGSVAFAVDLTVYSGSVAALAADTSENIYAATPGGVSEYVSIPNSIYYNSGGGLFTVTHAPSSVAVDSQGDLFFGDDAGGAAYGTYIYEQANKGVTSLQANVGAAGQPIVLGLFNQGDIASCHAVTLGHASSDFSVSSADCAAVIGGVYSTPVAFTPTQPGLRMGAVQFLNSAGNIVVSVPVSGIGIGPVAAFPPGALSTVGSGFHQPFGVAVDGSGNLFVADYAGNSILEMAYAGGTYGSPVTVAGNLAQPSGIAIDGDGNIYVSERANGTVAKLALQQGNYGLPAVIASGFIGNYGIAVDTGHNVYVAEYSSNRIKQIPFSNGSYGTPVAVGGSFVGPLGVAVDATGSLYVAEFNGNDVKLVPYRNGVYQTASLLGSGFTNPADVAVDAAGNVYVADRGNDRVKQIPLVGGAYGAPVLLTGSYGIPESLTLDASGNLYVAAASPASIKKIDLADAPSLAFAPTSVGSTSSDSPQLITLANAGNASLNLAIPNVGLNPSVPSNFGYGNSSTCTQLSSVSGGTSSIPAGGSCAIAINFAPVAAGNVSGSIVITDDAGAQQIGVSGTGILPAPTIAFSVANTSYGTGPITLNATSNSSGAITYTLIGGPATLSGNLVSLSGAGSVTLQVNVAADVNYTAGTQQSTFAVAQAVPSLAFTPPSQVYYGSPAITLNATSNSTGAVTYNVLSGPAALVGNTLTFTGTGSVSVRATVASDANYLSETNTEALAVLSPSPVINFSVPNRTYGDPAFAVNATSNSTGSFTYAVLSGPATVSGSTVTLTGAGTVTLRATQAAATPYLTETQLASFTVAQASDSISFSLSNHTYGDAPIALAATSASTGSITYSVLSGPATVSGNIVTFTGSGAVLLQASQAADGNYLAGTQTAGFTVAVARPVVTWAQPASIEFGTPLSSRELNATATFQGNTVPGTLTYTQSAGTLLPAGTDTLSVQFTPTNPTQFSAVSTSTTIVVANATTATALTSSLNPAIAGNAQVTAQSTTLTATVASATAGFGGAVTFFDGATAIATVPLTGNTAMYTASSLSFGTHTLTATYVGSPNYSGSTSLPLTETVYSPVPFTSNSSLSAIVAAGQTTVTTLTVTPQPWFAGTVNFTCTGLPAGTVCNFLPSNAVAVAKGGGAQAVTLSIVTETLKSARDQSPHGHRGTTLACVLGMPGLLLGSLGLRRKWSPELRRSLLAMMLVVGLAGAATLTGCGSSGPQYDTTAKGSYTFQVVASTAVNGVTTTQTTPVSLSVQ